MTTSILKRDVIQEIAQIDKYPTDALIILLELTNSELYIRTAIDWL